MGRGRGLGGDTAIAANTTDAQQAGIAASAAVTEQEAAIASSPASRARGHQINQECVVGRYHLRGDCRCKGGLEGGGGDV